MSEKTQQIHLDGPQSCPIQSVTVYNDRAEVTRLVTLAAEKEGQYEVVVRKLSQRVMDNSVHVSGAEGEATILEVSLNTAYHQEEVDKTDFGTITAEINALQEEQLRLAEEQDRISREQAWLHSWADHMKKPFGGAFLANEAPTLPSFDPLSTENLDKTEKFLDFYERVMAKHDTRNARIKRLVKDIDEKREKLNLKLNPARKPRVQTQEVTINLQILKAGKVSIMLSYVVYGAYWSPSYDIRVTTSNGHTQVTYHGQITNSTHEDWEKTDISLSTATPSLGGSPPELKTVHVSWKHSDNPFGGRENRDYEMAHMMMSQQPIFSQAPQFARSMGTLQESTIPQSVLVKSEQTLSCTTFRIPHKANIISDGKSHKVTIAVLELDSRFTYSLVPKLTSNAYLKASTLNSSQIPFLAGPANVFMDSNFVTTSQLRQVSPGESFAFFLGTDSSVIVELQPEKRMDEVQGLLTKASVRTVRQDTVIKNNKDTEIAIVLYEQLPLSSDEKIKVKLVSPVVTENKEKEAGEAAAGSVKLNSSNNIEYRRVIPAKQQLTFQLEYVLEWPKDKNIEVV